MTLSVVVEPSMPTASFLRPSWYRMTRSTVIIALLLAVLFVVLRILGMLGPALMRWALPLGFVLMATVPWIFLTGDGRRRIGLVPAQGAVGYGIALLCGVALASACFAIALGLFAMARTTSSPASLTVIAVR